MSLSIQTSAAALATLEALTTQQNAQTGASTGASGADSLADSTSASTSTSSIVNLSGGSAAATLNGLTGSLATSASIADAAVTAGTSIEDILSQIRQDAVTASDPSLDADSRAALNSGFQAGLAQIQAAVSSANVGGVNLIDGSVSGQLTAPQAASATLTGANLSLGGPLIGVSADASLSDPSTAASLASQLGAAIDNVTGAVGQIASQGQAIASHLSLVAQAGISLGGSTVDTGLDADSARLSALQLQQQLSVSGGSIANQSPQGILSLFR